MDYKLTNKRIEVKKPNGQTLFLPAEIKVYKDDDEKYTDTIFGNFEFKDEDLKPS